MSRRGRGTDTSFCGANQHVDLGGCMQAGKPCCVCNDGFVGTPQVGCLDEGAAGAAAAAVAASGCRQVGGTPTADGDCWLPSEHPGEAPPRPAGCPDCPTCSKPINLGGGAPQLPKWSWQQFAVGVAAGLAGGMVLGAYLRQRSGGRG